MRLVSSIVFEPATLPLALLTPLWGGSADRPWHACCRPVVSTDSAFGLPDADPCTVCQEGHPNLAPATRTALARAFIVAARIVL